MNPKTLRLTHFAVRGKDKPHPQWLVPVEEVAETTADLIRLRCNRDGLAEMKPFTITEYRQWVLAL